LNKEICKTATGIRVRELHYLPPLAASSTTGLVLASHLLGEGDKSHQEGHKHQRCTGPLHCQPRVISHMETAQYTHHDKQFHSNNTAKRTDEDESISVADESG
jgi:hypothetical protein